MKAKFLILFTGIILLSAWSSESFSQSFGGVGFFKPGFQTMQFDQLNSHLPTSGPQISNRPLTTAGAGYGVMANIVIGGEGGSVHAGSFTKGDQQIDLAGGFGFFSLGYIVVNKKKVIIYPLVSIGGNDLQIYIHQKGQSSSFTNVSGEPFQATTINLITKILKFSLSGLYALQGNSDKGAAGLMIGLEAGYQVGYKTGKWSYDNGDITGAPDFNSNAFFVQLMIGGGGIMRK